MLSGSAATGSLGPESDVDLIAVADVLSRRAALGLATRLSHDNLPCPARELEFVVYDRAGLAASPPRFALNLNTGADRRDRVGIEPAAEAWHWFPIDLSIARACGRALVGPAPAQALPEPRGRLLMEALLDSLEWHERAGAPDRGANAWRALQFVETGSWTNKAEARHAVSGCETATVAAARRAVQAELDRLGAD